MIVATLPRPFFTNWTFSGSFRPVLLLGIAGTSSVALVSSISKSDQTKENLNKALETIAVPFKPLTDKLGQGYTKMFESLGNWAQYGRPVASAIVESFTSGSVSTGSRAILNKLQEWWKSIYESLKVYGPWLFKSETWSHLKSLSQILKNLLNADMKGNAPLLFSLFKAAGNKEFTNFMDTMGKFADKQKEMFDNFSSEEMGQLFEAFNGDSEFTQKVLDGFAEQPKNNNLKNELMQALKPAQLKGKIKVAIEKAQGYLAKGIKTEEDRRGAQETKNEIANLKVELQKVITEAKKKLGK